MARADAGNKRSGHTRRGVCLLILCLYRAHDEPCTVLSAIWLSIPSGLTVTLGLDFYYTGETPSLITCRRPYG